MPKMTDAHMFLSVSWHLPVFNSLVRIEKLISLPLAAALSPSFGGIAMSEPGELQAAKAELRRKNILLQRANERHDELLGSDSPEPREVLKAKVGVAEAKVGVAEAEVGVAQAKVGIAEAELDEAKANKDTPEQKIAELKENVVNAKTEVANAKTEVANAKTEVADAKTEVAKADWELAKARKEDEDDIKVKRRAYEKALEGQL
jgi:chromosome segregation ATPase